MPRLGDDHERLLQTGQELNKRAKRTWDEFANFALSENVLEVAVGLIIAAAFTAVVNSFVSDILLPPISLLPFFNRNLNEKFAVLKRGPRFKKTHGYNTAKQALDDGAIIMVYGNFLSKVVNFFGIAIALFFIARFYGWVSDDSVIKHTVKCKYCRKRISKKAKRCVNCTSWQDGRED